MQRSSAPLGYDRFMELVKSDFFDDMVLYRTIKGERTRSRSILVPWYYLGS